MVNVIISGGGIGGLSAALCCLQHGHQVTVLEQATELGEIGAGLQLSPNAMKVLEALGLDQQLAKIGFRPEGIEIRMGISGMRLIHAPLGEIASERWGAPYLHIHRADLVSVLGAAVEARAPGSVRLGCSVTGFSQDRAGVTAQIANGEPVRGDVIIGADGIHSPLRAQILGPDAPTFTGNAAWRAVVPVEKLGRDVPRPVAGAWMGRGKHAVTYLLRGGDLANFVGVVERDDWTGESWTEPGSRADALADFEGWDPVITRLISEADTLYRWALYDRAPLKTWTDGRVALLGDAAHPMLPFMAQGAAMAIEDAWALSRCLSQDLAAPEALKSYQRIRYARATKVQAGSRANAKTFHQRTGFGRLKTYGPIWLAGRIAPVIGLMRQDAVYGYDIIQQTERALGRD